MKNTLLLILVAGTLAMNCGTPQEFTTYYIDVDTGSDENRGTSQEKAWKTCVNIANTTFNPGDKLLLKKGQIFQGSISLDSADCGTADRPIIIGTYGGVNYSAPVIHSGRNAALSLNRTKWISVSGIVAVGSGRKSGNQASGILMDQCTNITIDSLEVSGYQYHGIDVSSSRDITITRVRAHDNGRTGIRTGGDRMAGTVQFPTKNIYIGYSETYDNAGDDSVTDNHSGSGIIVSMTDSAVIEYCSAWNNGWDMPRKGNGPVGIWAHDANNITIQYCISYNNEAPHGAWDGGGFDFDGGITNSVMQYNYSYDNNGAGYGLFQYAGTTVWENNTIRYNISYNDGDGREFAGMYIWTAEPDKDLLRNCLIYNNVLVNELGNALKFAVSDEGIPSDPNGFEFYNNVFISMEEPIKGTCSNSVFSHNAWWKTNGSKITKNPDIHGVDEFPGLALPRPDNYRITDPAQLKTLHVFRLQDNSVCMDAGKTINNNGGSNFWNEAIENPPNIGAH